MKKRYSLKQWLCFVFLIAIGAWVLGLGTTRKQWTVPEIYGVVLDMSDGDPISNVRVELEGMEQSVAITDDNGKFHFAAKSERYFFQLTGGELFVTTLKASKRNYVSTTHACGFGYGKSNRSSPPEFILTFRLSQKTEGQVTERVNRATTLLKQQQRSSTSAFQ